MDKGKVYLFEIRNQDTNDGKQEGHKNNLHTMYWRALFEDIENKPKLNGGAEIFYRKALLQEKQEKTQDKHGKEVIKNFRFSKEKFLFHCPIKLNYRAKSYSKPEYALSEINKKINGVLITSNNLNFLGIDRGEKHLAYYSLIDKNGKIKGQGTLNIPFVDKSGNQRIVKAKKRILDKDGKEHVETVECQDYNELLEARAGDRDYARKNWQTIGTIKELKEGYISQVVRKITDLAVANNTFIIMEDLNTGFKRGRQKIEKSVYQKLELALAKKLNFLVDKSAKNGELGSVTKALQLTSPINNYKDIENRKQVGIMLYARANYTSQTDPISGWRKTIYFKKGSEESIRQQIIDQFSDIGFNGIDYYFVYTDSNGKKWTLYSGKNGKSLDRFRGQRGKDKYEWIIKKINVNQMLNILFENFDKNRSLLSQIIDENIQLNKIENEELNPNKGTAWDSFRFVIDIIQQIRNTGIEKTDSDFILSPVRDENGTHFDSRVVSNNQPNSGDANGAYNIARKGLIILEHIKRGYKLYISDGEWDAWLHGKEKWEEWIVDNYKKYLEKSISTIHS